jgi:hypothetical protein
MQRTPFVKALSITLLLSCANVSAMQKSSTRKQPQPAVSREKTAATILSKGTNSSSQEGSPITVVNSNHAPSPEPEASPAPEKGILQDEAIVNAIATSHTPSAPKETVTTQEVTPALKQAIKTLLGKELIALYNTDEKPLVQKGFLWSTDATIPYKDEGRLITGLEKNDANYLKDVQAQQDLNRTLNHVCAGIIQKIKEQSTLDPEKNIRSFTIEQIEAILTTQVPRLAVLSRILGLCDARIKAKQEPVLHPAENAKELVQKCFTAISQLQLERKLVRSQEENDNIRKIKDGQRLAYAMRLTSDKGSISDDEYNDSFIFDRTKAGI